MNHKNIFISGATGNVGMEVIRYLKRSDTNHKIIIGLRNLERGKKLFHSDPDLEYRHFDFENAETFDIALEGIDTMFLLRPPPISDIDTYFRPLLDKMKEKQVREVVFLSVQGVEKSKIIPHHKIENLLLEYGFPYIFIRPSYFMQNLLTELYSDIKNKREIILPAGKAKFNWVDIENIGEAAAMLLADFSSYQNQAYDITGYENESFYSVTEIINEVLAHKISYRPVNPLKFYQIKKREGIPKGKIMVMIMLHFLPRFQKEPCISTFYEQLCHQKPNTLKDFIEREKQKLS